MYSSIFSLPLELVSVLCVWLWKSTEIKWVKSGELVLLYSVRYSPVQGTFYNITLPCFFSSYLSPCSLIGLNFANCQRWSPVLGRQKCWFSGRWAQNDSCHQLFWFFSFQFTLWELLASMVMWAFSMINPLTHIPVCVLTVLFLWRTPSNTLAQSPVPLIFSLELDLESSRKACTGISGGFWPWEWNWVKAIEGSTSQSKNLNFNVRTLKNS